MHIMVEHPTTDGDLIRELARKYDLNSAQRAELGTYAVGVGSFTNHVFYSGHANWMTDARALALTEKSLSEAGVPSGVLDELIAKMFPQ